MRKRNKFKLILFSALLCACLSWPASAMPTASLTTNAPTQAIVTYAETETQNVEKEKSAYTVGDIVFVAAALAGCIAAAVFLGRDKKQK